MAITLNGTTGISSPGGDTSTSLATTNLSYTGTLTGGTGVINIGSGQIYKDSSGNLGLGVTPSAWQTDRKPIQLGSGGNVSGSVALPTFVEIGNNFYTNSSGVDVYLTTGTAAKYRQVGNVHSWHVAASGTAGTAVTGFNSVPMTLDASGRLGIGNTSPQFCLEVDQNTTSSSPNKNSAIQVYTRGYGGGGSYYGGIGFAMHEHTNGYWGCGIQAIDDTGSYGAGLTFSTSTGSATPTSTERARIDSSGNLIVGDTATTGAAKGYVNCASGSNGWTTKLANNANVFFNGYYGSTQNYYVSGTGIVYSTQSSNNVISDISQKENIRFIPYGLGEILGLNPVMFDFKSGCASETKNNLGFIAQEVEPIIPELVTAWGEEKHKGLRTGDLIPVLVKAIQELSAKVTALEAK